MIHLQLKFWHMEGLSSTGLDQSWKFPYTTTNESGQSSLHSWQRDSQTSHNCSLYASHMPWSSPQCLKGLSYCCILYWWWGLLRHQQAHIAKDFKLSIQPIGHQLWLNSWSTEYKHLREDSILQKLNRIPSWVPAAKDCIYPPPPTKYRSPNAQDVGVALT